MVHVAWADVQAYAARQTPRWAELDQADRLYPTALTAVHAFRAR